MAQYRKKPILTEATQWFKNGDHPRDLSEPIEGSPNLTEGQVVKFFRSLNIPGARICQKCGNVMQRHGILDAMNRVEFVCPGDYIVTDQRGTGYYILKPEQFEQMYEPIKLGDKDG